MNLSLRCIKPTIKEASLTSFMESQYNTQMQEQTVYSRKKNRQRKTEAKEHRVSSQISQRPFESSRHLTFIAMEPPKQEKER
jgi:hypothetical protein